MEDNLAARISEQERALKTLRARLRFTIIALVVMATIAVPSIVGADRQTDKGLASLRLKELVIVDEKGLIRVLLSADVPDAVVDGRSIPRGERAAGIILYDDTGRERSGYVTFSPSGNVALTLDTRDHQVALFAADPKSGVTARLWEGDGWVEMRADGSGARLSIGRSNQLVFVEPEMTDTEFENACSSLRDELRHLDPKPPYEQILQACKRRMSEAACRKCLDRP